MNIVTLIGITLTEFILCQENGPTVTTGSGPIKGIKVEDHFEFLGIPYAEAPVGKLRFMPPEPVSLTRLALLQLSSNQISGPIPP